jgi:hypothetical protein
MKYFYNMLDSRGKTDYYYTWSTKIRTIGIKICVMLSLFAHGKEEEQEEVTYINIIAK